MNKAAVGKVYPATGTYQVGREAIFNFAQAINDDNPLYIDLEAARKAGYPDVVAPPTFLMAVGQKFSADSPLFDPEVGLNFAQVVHAEMRFTLHRPVVAGDVLTATCRITEIKEVSVHELLGTETDVHDADGRLVATMFSSVISRGTAAKKEA